jgi:hypothetical protein
MSAGIYLFALDTTASPPNGKTGDSANVTGHYSVDGAAGASFATTHPTEIGGGVYWQPLAAAETAGLQLAYYWASTTTGIVIDPVFQMTMPSNIKKGTGVNNFMYYMALSIDGKSPATGLSPLPTVQLSQDGGAFASGSLSGNAEVGGGWYSIDLANADMNANEIVLRASATGCDTTQYTIITQP